jgi:hypothetical protein
MAAGLRFSRADLHATPYPIANTAGQMRRNWGLTPTTRNPLHSVLSLDSQVGGDRLWIPM